MALTLPANLKRKIEKTGQTRGATDDQIFQNRVARNSTVLIPYGIWDKAYLFPDGENLFEGGFIAIVNPSSYFSGEVSDQDLRSRGLEIGHNALLFYETRAQWNQHQPIQFGLTPGTSRESPLGGQYIARVPGITSQANGAKINHGYNTTLLKGAGIRLYEYATNSCIAKCRIQLEAIYWMCADSIEAAIEYGMPMADAKERRKNSFNLAQETGLLDINQLHAARVIDKDGETVCPLCLMKLSAKGFYSRMAQAEGREVADLTVTEINLFHINELRYSAFNHKPYNLGWGHHHCNTVTKDAGIGPTIDWMRDVVGRNRGLFE